MSKLLVNEIEPVTSTGIGIGGPNTQPSAILNIKSTEQGLLIPRMTTTERDDITSPADGLLIYNTDTKEVNRYNLGTSSWQSVDGIKSINGQIAQAQIINTGTSGTSPNISQTGSAINTINIPQASTSGVTAGLISKADYDSFNSRLFATKNVVYVNTNSNPGPQGFNSIVDALASITDASSSNPYKIQVGPGIFTGTLIMKSWVWIEGAAHDQTIVVATSGDHAIYGADDSGISKCLIRGATTSGKAGVFYLSTVGTTKTSFFVQDVRFGDNDHLSIADGSSAATAIFVENCKFGSTYQFNHGFLGRNGGRVVVRNSTTTGLSTPFPDYVFKAIGAGSQIVLNGLQVRSGSITTGACVHLADGATLRALSVDIRMFGKAIWSENVGAGDIIDAVGILCEANTMDIVIENPSTDGTFNGSADHTKIFVDPNSTFGTVFSCNHLPSDSTGFVVVGDVLQGERYDRLANLSKIAREATPLGVVSGGIIQNPTSLNVDVTSGTGFLIDPTDIFVKEIVWNFATLSITADTTVYIYVDTNGTIQQSLSPSSLITTIPLGRISADSTGIRFIEAVEMDMVHTGNKVEQFLRNLGPVFGSGAIVSESGTRGLDVTAGSYNYGINVLTLSGGTGISYLATFQDGSGGWIESVQSTVSNSQYDDGSGTLASIPSGEYATHTLYVIGDSGNETYFLMYSQDTYATLSLAEAADLPLVPSYISDGVARLARIIVQEGVTNIVEILDVRPRIGFAAPATAGTTDHGSLLGLLDDDHPQYLPISGSRAMSGNLNMGGNNLTSLGTANGVIIETHASRHLPAGADPLTTAAPTTHLDSTTSNSTGTANSLSRSDHTHAINTGTPSSQVPDQANAAGTSANLAKADHIHNIPTAAPVANLDSTTSNSQGVAATFARSDHGHAVSTGAPVAQTPNQTNNAGSSANLAKADHIHNIPTAAPVAQTPDQSNSDGAATTFSKSDHIHNIPTATAVGLDATSTSTQGAASSFARSNHTHAIASGAPSSQTPDQANAAGTSANLAKADHIHNIPTAAASTISGNSNTQGAASTFARSDHAHQLTSGSATISQVPQFDGTNWQATSAMALRSIALPYAMSFNDDFPVGSTTNVGELDWVSNITGASTITSNAAKIDSNHPGVIQIKAGNAGGALAGMTMTPCIVLGGGALVNEWLMQIETLATGTNDYVVRIGIGDSGSADFTNGVYFEYNRATSANWIIKTASASTRTSTTTSTAVAAGAWTKLRIEVNAAASSVTYYVNGASVGTITTNIPTAATGFAAHQVRVAGTPVGFDIDYFTVYQTFTSSR